MCRNLLNIFFAQTKIADVSNFALIKGGVYCSRLGGSLANTESH